MRGHGASVGNKSGREKQGQVNTLTSNARQELDGLRVKAVAEAGRAHAGLGRGGRQAGKEQHGRRRVNVLVRAGFLVVRAADSSVR